MKCKEVMTHILSDTMPSWMKYHNEKDVRVVRKVYSIGDLRYVNDCDLLSSEMSKPQFEKFKRHLPSSSNLTLNNNTILTSTLGKLLVRKLTHRSTADMTKSTIDLNSNSKRDDSSITDKNMISKENIQFIERIGEGKFSTVFKAFYRTKQNEILTVAIKKFNQEVNHNDISVSRDIKHPHIVQFFGIVIHIDNSVMLVIEYAHLKSLYECLISTNGKCEYSIEVLLEFIKQITSAMSYLEKKFLIHRNLCCRNFLVFNKSLIKLSDLGFLWKDKSKLPIAWMSPEVIHSHRFTTASDIFSFGISMWECFTYGQVPWKEMTNDEIVNSIDAPNHQRLPRPPYATSELYQIMLHCWKYEPSERPTFSQLEKTLGDIEFKQVRWKDNNNQSIHLPDDFLSIESCLRGPLTILDRCLHIPISSTTNNNFIQCVSADGQIGFVYNDNVEPLHIISISKSTSSTMNYIFHRKTGIKKNSTKTKSKQISKDMISSPQSDFIHAFHVGVTGETFGDITCLNTTEKPDLIIESDSKQTDISSIEQTSSLFDEVMQAFTDIYSETESTSIDTIDPNMQSPSLSRLISKLTIKKSNETSSRFTRELEERSRNGDLSEQGKHAYNLLINRCISTSSSTHDEHSSSSLSNQEKSDSHSHYSSISSLNSRSSSINKNAGQPSLTGKPLPPPPDLSSLGSKLTTATMKQTFKLPASLTSNKYQTKKRFNLFT